MIFVRIIPDIRHQLLRNRIVGALDDLGGENGIQIDRVKGHNRVADQMEALHRQDTA